MWETITDARQFPEGISASQWTQDGRLIAIQTPLGKDRLLLTSLVGEEAISRLFTYQVEMLSLDQAISAEGLIGRSATMTIALEGDKTRPINGLISHLRIGPLVGRDLRLYSAHVVPWLSYLRHTTDCRIFQNLNVPDIIQQVFQTYGFTDFEMAVAHDEYPRLEFCVQYRETAFDFVSRLMEEVGIFYFFRHEDDRHVLVIADKNASFRSLPDQHLIYAPPDNPQSGNITQWENDYDFRPGRWSQKDFDFQQPSSDLTTMERTVLKVCNAQTFERFDYPGRYTEKDLGSKWTRRLMEMEEAAHHSVQGSGDYACLDAGGKFMLANHPGEDSKKVYVIRRVRHKAVAQSYLNQAEPSHYANTFEAIPYDAPFRPLRITERPFVHGPQTAIVVGPPGEKIFTDKYGRVRVQFHWDRYGKYDDKSSCWIRVSHAWAGRGWGSVNLPHVGHEVVVSFLEGDPDRPLVTGRVYNAENMKAMGMPENRTQSAIRDYSGNEIVLEGKPGFEDIRIHTTKDMNVVVTNDYNETVKYGKRNIDVQSGTHTETIKSDTTITVTSGKYEHCVQANTAHRSAKGTHTIDSTAANVLVQANTEVKLLVGASSLYMESDGTITLHGAKLHIDGTDSIELTAPSVTVGGKTCLDLQLSGKAICSMADTTNELHGATVTTNATETMNVIGSLVKIN
jgi:type VI secretion system secreted protein VgrG